MTAYLLILLFLMGIYYLRVSIVDRGIQVASDYSAGSKFTIINTSIILVLFIGLRGLSGTDTPFYQGFYYSGIYPSDIEPLYKNLSIVLSESNYNFWNLQLIVAAITILPITYTLINCSKNYCLSLLILYLSTFPMMMMNVARQMIAVSLLFFFVMLAIQIGGKFSSIVLISGIIVSYNFHHSTIIGLGLLLIAYVLYTIIRCNFKMLVIFGALSLIWSIVMYTSNFGYSIMVELLKIPVFEKYVYAATPSDFIMHNSPFALIVGVCLSLVSIVLGLTLDKNTVTKVSIFLIAINVVYSMTISSQVLWITDRCGTYLMPFMFLMLPNLLHGNQFRKNGQKISFILYFLFLGVHFTRTMLNNYGGFAPYDSQIFNYFVN